MLAAEHNPNVPQTNRLSSIWRQAGNCRPWSVCFSNRAPCLKNTAQWQLEWLFLWYGWTMPGSKSKERDIVFFGEKLPKNEFMEVKEILQVRSRLQGLVHTIPSGWRENVLLFWNSAKISLRQGVLNGFSSAWMVQAVSIVIKKKIRFDISTSERAYGRNCPYTKHHCRRNQPSWL